MGWRNRENEIVEGRLVERPCPDCDGIERRAFGEFESFRGELASYAIGWTSGHEDPVGHMTIGIGAGNEGGASFHIEIRIVEGGDWGMGLVDRPFEDVPEGGPDLDREEALAHDTLPFIWAVADIVMVLDRRAVWMEHWLKGTGALATHGVMHGLAPITHVVRTEDEELGWELLCDTEDEPEGHAFHLFHALDHDHSLLELLDLEPGERADRDGPGEPWVRG